MYEQIPLIDRAKKDGVKRFIASEFGVDHRTVTSPFFEAKREIAKYVQEASFPDGWTAVASGFLEWTIPLFVKVDSQTSLITVAGSGKTQYPFIIRYDIGRILAETFRNPSKYKDTWIFAANSWLSLDEIAQYVQNESQLELKIQHEELNEKTPVLQLLEQDGLQIFERSQQSDFAKQQADIKEVIKGYFKPYFEKTAD
ncbi:hypothetical protein TGAMA5MH_06861 [Trichoderma gamsii]|uniref:NmrA-like domain-containing protein n=1 Tax=Trichoderma gamsii TaxID=398673 RepID=A0A2K0T647_9HYPO|nr:hypothetical protein TGAMA5MH_06861 [Trichoderma gamsii]